MKKIIVIKYGPTQNLCSAYNPSKVHTHTPFTHTHTVDTPGEVVSHLCLGAQGAVYNSLLYS